MKFLLAIGLVIVSSIANASTRDSKSVVFDGTRGTDSLKLVAEQTHTEYRYEDRAKTCYREEFIGYRRTCETRYERVCHEERDCRIINGVRQCTTRPVCRNYPRQHCWDQPVYRTVPYTCYETVRVPYEVKDYDVIANVEINYQGLPAGTRANEEIRATLNGDQVSLGVTRSSGELVLKATRNVTESINGRIKTVNAVYVITSIDAKTLRLPLTAEIKDFAVAADKDTLTFTTGAVADLNLVSVKTRIFKVRGLARDVLLATNDLATGLAKVVNRGTRAEWTVKMSDMGIDSSDLKAIKVEVAIAPNMDMSNVLNPSVLPNEGTKEGSAKINLK